MTAEPKPLSGGRLLLAGLLLALSNFMVVLDLTVANVSVPHISGSLGVSATQGTWVVTSYSVAEAICVPLTGWLARRFGTVRSLVVAVAGFVLFSVLCGFATTLGMLVACRIGQGLSGGPVMPLTQTLLMRVFPKEKQGQAMAIWAMTTVLGPIVGPIAGGTISDNWSRPWIFFINLPIGLLCIFGMLALLRGAETEIERRRIDVIGLVLMVTWIGALQVMLDLGRERDWFGSSFIVGCAIVAAIGFVAFMVWELTEEEPVVDLRVFRHRGFSVGTAALALTFGNYFATIVIVPQWLQGGLGYTATQAGHVTAMGGVLALILSPVVGSRVGKVDPRLMISFGMAWLAATSLLRAFWWSSGADFWTLAIPQLLQGLGVPFFMIPLTTLALGTVPPEETASAAGVMSFLRTLAAAVGTSVAATMWEEHTHMARNGLVNVISGADVMVAGAADSGLTGDQGRSLLERLVKQEAVAIASNQLFVTSAVIFVVAAAIIWLAPKPARLIEAGAAH